MDIRFTTTAGYDLYSGEEVTASGIGGGSIQLENGWQLISIPIEYGYWDSTAHQHVHDDVTVSKVKNYVIDQIEDLYGAGNVQVCNTYLGDNQFFYSYVVGSTPESSPHNFQLIYNDSGNKEITGFWLRSLSVTDMIITWGE